MSRTLAARGRFALVGLGALALLAGMWAGLLRIGWSLPLLEPNLPAIHGPLMLGGFLGLVIALERAVALGRLWAYAAPGLVGLSTLALLVGLPSAVGAGLLLLGSLVLVVVFERIYRLRAESSTLVMVAGAAVWAVGNLVWLLQGIILAAVPWWVGFVVLTIVGERLELAQVLLPARSRVLLLGVMCVLVAGLALSILAFALGVQLAGASLVGLAGWLLSYDVARRSVRRTGLARFGGLALLLGYAWLLVAGLIWLLGPERAFTAGFWYDALLHSVFLGFAFSMIFGHAPTIIPALTGRPVPFTPRFYTHLILLHVSLALRIAGDVTAQADLRALAGMLNVIAILVFLGLTAAAPAARPWPGGAPATR